MDAKVYQQCEPVAAGRGWFDGMEAVIWEANLQYLGTVQGVTKHECWHRAKVLTSAPVMEWVK